MTHQINISFTKENKLKIILDDKLVDSKLKLCFSFATGNNLSSVAGFIVVICLGSDRGCNDDYKKCQPAGSHPRCFYKLRRGQDGCCTCTESASLLLVHN